MRQWVVRAGASSLDDMALLDVPEPQAGPGEVLVRVRACSLNYRDQIVPQGLYMGGTVPVDTVPLSDGAGEVVGVGAGVTSVKPGDRVAGIFFQNWIDGPPNPGAGPALGAPPATGMLQELVVLPEHGVVPLAQGLFRRSGVPALRRGDGMERADGRPAPGSRRGERAGAWHGRCFAPCAADRQGSRRASDRNQFLGRKARPGGHAWR